jgi:Ca2+/H+ antiporter, TMEM165/GDT1 family
MMLDWLHAGPTMLASFLASFVEFVEALTVVLAVGTVRGWRDALGGSGAALLVLLILIAVLGPGLTRIPLESVQLIIGSLLLLFGMRWLRKAVLRAAGIIAPHDEAEAFAKQTAELSRLGLAHGSWDKVAFTASFKITMLEGIEVVFIVVAIGAGGVGLLVPASLGALAALIVVIALGILVHRPLATIPENTLKFIVGVLLAAFGSFWVGEGLGMDWPGEDSSIPGLIAGFLIVAWMAVALCRRAPASATMTASGS